MSSSNLDRLGHLKINEKDRLTPQIVLDEPNTPLIRGDSPQSVDQVPNKFKYKIEKIKNNQNIQGVTQRTHQQSEYIIQIEYPESRDEASQLFVEGQRVVEMQEQQSMLSALTSDKGAFNKNQYKTPGANSVHTFQSRQKQQEQIISKAIINQHDITSYTNTQIGNHKKPIIYRKKKDSLAVSDSQNSQITQSKKEEIKYNAKQSENTIGTQQVRRKMQITRKDTNNTETVYNSTQEGIQNIQGIQKAQVIYSNQEIKLVTENTPEKSIKMSKFDIVGYQEMVPMISSPSEIRSQESIIQKTRNSNKDNNFSSFKTNEIVFCQNEDSFMNQNVEEYFQTPDKNKNNQIHQSIGKHLNEPEEDNSSEQSVGFQKLKYCQEVTLSTQAMRIKKHIDLLQNKINIDQDALDNLKIQVTEVINQTNHFIDQITKESLNEICDIQNPPDYLQEVVKCVMKILQKKNSWSYAVKIISKDKALIQSLKDVQIQFNDPDSCAQLQTQTQKFQSYLQKIQEASEAAGLLAQWCISINKECVSVNEINILEEILFNNRNEFMIQIDLLQQLAKGPSKEEWEILNISKKLRDNLFPADSPEQVVQIGCCFLYQNDENMNLAQKNFILSNYAFYITNSFDVIHFIKHNTITQMIKEDQSDEIIFVLKHKSGNQEKIRMILQDRNEILHIVRDEIEYQYPMQTYTTFQVPALSIQDYLVDYQKPSQQYRIEAESKISRDYLILDALSEVYNEANEQMLINEENTKIITEIKEQITDRTKNDQDMKTQHYVVDLLDQIYDYANQNYFSGEEQSQTSVTKSVGKTPMFKKSISQTIKLQEVSSGRATNFINENDVMLKENINSFVDATIGERCPSSCTSNIHHDHMNDCSIGTNDKDWRNNININVEYQIGDKLEQSSQNTQHEAEYKSCQSINDENIKIPYDLPFKTAKTMQTQRVAHILGSKLGSDSTSRYMGTIKTNSQISNFDYHVIKYEEIIKNKMQSRLVELLGDHQVSSIDGSVQEPKEQSLCNSDRKNVIKYEQIIKDKIKGKLEELLGLKQQSSNASVKELQECTIKSEDRAQVIQFEELIRKQLKLKLEEILGQKNQEDSSIETQRKLKENTIQSSDRQNVIKYEQLIKERLRMKLEDLLGCHAPSSNSSQAVVKEQSLKSTDRRQVINYENEIKMKMKLKLEELLGGRQNDSENGSVEAPLDLNSLHSSDRKQVINFEIKIKDQIRKRLQDILGLKKPSSKSSNQEIVIPQEESIHSQDCKHCIKYGEDIHSGPQEQNAQTLEARHQYHNSLMGEKISTFSSKKTQNLVTISQISNFDHADVIQYEQEIKLKIRNKLEELLGTHKESSRHSSIQQPDEASINSNDRQQIIQYESKIKLQIKNKLEEILGMRMAHSDDDSEIQAPDERSIKSSDRKQIIEYEQLIKDKLKLKLEELLGLKCQESSNQSVIEMVEACSIKSTDRKQVINYESMIKDKLKLKLEELLGLKCDESSNQTVIEMVEACSIKSSDRKQVINYESLIKDKLKRKLEEMLGFKKPDTLSEQAKTIPQENSEKSEDMSYVIDYQKSIINENDIKEAERAVPSNDQIQLQEEQFQKQQEFLQQQKQEMERAQMIDKNKLQDEMDIINKMKQEQIQMREEAEKMKLELQNAKEEQLRINQQLSENAEAEKLKLIQITSEEQQKLEIEKQQVLALRAKYEEDQLQYEQMKIEQKKLLEQQKKDQQEFINQNIERQEEKKANNEQKKQDLMKKYQKVEEQIRLEERAQAEKEIQKIEELKAQEIENIQREKEIAQEEAQRLNEEIIKLKQIKKQKNQFDNTRNTGQSQQLTEENNYRLEVQNIQSYDQSPENELQSNEPLFNCSNQYEENLRLNMNNSTENDNDNENYQEKGIDYKYEGSVILDSNDDHPDAEYLDKVEIEPLQQTTLGSPISVMKLDKLSNIHTPEKFQQSQQKQFEQAIVTLNRQFRDQLNKEPEVELEMIKENQWENEIKDEHSLINSFIKNKNLESESMMSNFDKHYVYYIRPSDIKSYQTLKQAEELLLSPESDVLNAQIKNSLILITLNNFGQFYKKHMFKNIAELYFDLIMRLSQKHNISTVSMVSNMLRNCKNYSQSGKHHDALDEAVRCIKSLNFSIQLSENHKKMDKQTHRKNTKLETFRYHSRNFWLVVYISYYNMACELEFLKRISESLNYFEKAKRVLKNELGHQLPFKSIQQYLVQVPFFQKQVQKVSRHQRNISAFTPQQSCKNSKRQKSRNQSANSRGSFTNFSNQFQDRKHSQTQNTKMKSEGLRSANPNNQNAFRHGKNENQLQDMPYIRDKKLTQTNSFSRKRPQSSQVKSFRGQLHRNNSNSDAPIFNIPDRKSEQSRVSAMFESKKNLEIININATMPLQLKKQQQQDTTKFNDFIQGYIQNKNKTKPEKKYDRFMESKKKDQIVLNEKYQSVSESADLRFMKQRTAVPKFLSPKQNESLRRNKIKFYQMQQLSLSEISKKSITRQCSQERLSVSYHVGRSRAQSAQRNSAQFSSSKY